MAKGQTEQAHQAKKSLQRRGKSWLQRQTQLLSPRQDWDYKSRKGSLRTGGYPHQPPKVDTDLLSQNEHCVSIKPALKRSAWDSKAPPKQTLLWTAKESDVIFFLYISATKHKVAIAATGLKSRVKLDLPLVGAAKSGREGEDVKEGEEETKAEWQTEASAAHCHGQFPPGRALPPQTDTATSSDCLWGQQRTLRHAFSPVNGVSRPCRAAEWVKSTSGLKSLLVKARNVFF